MGVVNPARTPWRKRLFLPTYTVSEAARLVQVSPVTVARWHYGRWDRDTWQPPVLLGKQKFKPLSYLQLVELAFVSTFRRKRLSLKRIRKAREYLAQMFGVEFPFAQLDVRTDGARILKEYEAEDADLVRKLIVADQSGQLLWENLTEKRFEEFEYDPQWGLALTWHPRGKNVPIVLDPRVAFGAPRVRGTGVPTWVLKGRIIAGESLRQIQKDFLIDEQQLRAALEFEAVEVDRLAA